MVSTQDLIEKSQLNTAIETEELNIVKQLGLKPYRDGNMWCFLWGDDLHSGIAGFGETVQKAVYAFSKAYSSEILTAPPPIKINNEDKIKSIITESIWECTRVTTHFPNGSTRSPDVSRDENKLITNLIYNKLKANGMIND